MKFDLKAGFTFSGDISSIKKDVELSIFNFNKTLLEKDKTVNIMIKNIQKNLLSIDIISEGIFRPHNALLQMKNILSKEFGKKHKLGIREIKIESYTIDFVLEKKSLKEVKIPFASVKIKGKNVNDLDLEKIKNLIEQANKKSSKINLKGKLKKIV